MVKNINPNFDGKIESIEVEFNGFNANIEVYVFNLLKPNNLMDIGNIIETYRTNFKGDIKYVNENLHSVINYINNIKYPFPEFIPDSLFCFYPADRYRRKLLKCFSNILTSHLDNIKLIDFSSMFKKKDTSKSIKKDMLMKDDFELTYQKEESFNNLLVIDDVIDEGKTINILLELLCENGLINPSTNVKLICLYNRPKSKKFDLSQILIS
jgi:hypothetical protein